MWEKQLTDIYVYTGMISFGIFTVIFIMSWISQLTYQAYRFVNDIKEGDSILIRKNKFIDKKCFKQWDDAHDFFMKSCIAWLISMIVCFCWPAAYPTAIIFLFLLGLRAFIRFTKKVNKALVDKADKDHTH